MLFFIGACAGLAYGLSAFGGSLFAVVLLALLLGLPITTAMSMNLCMLVVLTTITAGDSVRARLPVPGFIWPFALTTSLGAGLGAVASVLLGETVLRVAYAPVCIIVAVAMLLLVGRAGPGIYLPRGALAAVTPQTPAQSPPPRSLALPMGAGGLGGLFVGLFGASGAPFLVPALGRTFSNIPGRAVACAEMAILPALLVATTISFIMQRTPDWQATGLMIFGALAGLSVARMLAPHFRAAIWNSVVALCLLTVAGWVLLFAQ